MDGLVAQLGERCVRNAEVMGSIPTRSTSRLCLLPMIGGRAAEIEIRYTRVKLGIDRIFIADGRVAEIGENPGFGVFLFHDGEARLDLCDSMWLCQLPEIGGRTAEIEIRHTMGRFGYHRSIPADVRAAEIGGSPGFGVFSSHEGKTCMAHMGYRSIAEIRMVYAIFP